MYSVNGRGCCSTQQTGAEQRYFTTKPHSTPRGTDWHMMETPLDVLSRAASIVDIRESVTAVAPTIGVKRSMDTSDKASPPEAMLMEIPSKFHKYRRHKEQQERSAAMRGEVTSGVRLTSTPPPGYEHGETSHSRKCAGTQTSFSSFLNGEPPPGYPKPNSPPAYSKPDSSSVRLDHHGNSNGGGGHPVSVAAVPYHFSRPVSEPSALSASTLPPPPQHMDMDNHNIQPLNLTITTSSSSSSSPRAMSYSPPSQSSRGGSQHLQQLPPRDMSATYSDHVFRASVITPVPATGGGAGSSPQPDATLLPLLLSNSSSSRGARAGHPAGHRDNTSQGICDSVIEEHFQRSLGRHYQSQTATPTATVSPVPVAPPDTTVTMATTPATMATPSQLKVVLSSVPSGSAAGSVDDHFAKSLGETWTKIKEKNDPMNADGLWSVDDHFAKALGDTWFKIKRAKEDGDSSSSGGEGSPQDGRSPAPHT